jgi:hypothetical protein
MVMAVNTLKTKIIDNMNAQFGPPDDAAILAKFAEAIAQSVYDEITQNADLNLLAGDIPVPASGILDSVSGPCTGSAQSSAVVLPTRIR